MLLEIGSCLAPFGMYRPTSKPARTGVSWLRLTLSASCCRIALAMRTFVAASVFRPERPDRLAGFRRDLDPVPFDNVADGPGRKEFVLDETAELQRFGRDEDR